MTTTRPTPYAELPGLDGYYFEDSYVLGIRLGGLGIAFDLLVVLTPGHPDYVPPPPPEQHRYRLGRLSFPRPTRFEFTTPSVVVPAVDAEGEIDLGNIDSLVALDGRYRIEGGWGVLEVESDPPTMDLTPPGALTNPE